MVAAQADSASVYWNGEGEQRERGMEKVSRERNGSGNFLCLIMAAHVRRGCLCRTLIIYCCGRFEHHENCQSVGSPFEEQRK